MRCRCSFFKAEFLHQEESLNSITALLLDPMLFAIFLSLKKDLTLLIFSSVDLERFGI